MDPNSTLRKLFPTCRRLLVEKSLELIPSANYQKVLVIGGGYDPYKDYFNASEVYTCLDIVHYPGATNIIADAHMLPFNKETYDCVVVIEVLEHIKNPFTFIKQVEDVLTMSGDLYISVPFMYHSHADPYDYWRPTSTALNTLLHGFREADVYYQGNRFHTILDLISTSFPRFPIFFPLRIINRLVCWAFSPINAQGKTSAPSGYWVIARK